MFVIWILELLLILINLDAGFGYIVISPALSKSLILDLPFH
jgi:hypothetical protein